MSKAMAVAYFPIPYVAPITSRTCGCDSIDVKTAVGAVLLFVIIVAVSTIILWRLFDL